MRATSAGVIGGLTAGVAMSLAMIFGRRAGVLDKTLAEHSEDWLDRTMGTRRRIGEGGTAAVEEANHMAAAATFGFGYGALRGCLPRVPGVLLGALYGAGLYAVNIAGAAPLLGITRGEQNAPAPVRAQRFGMHVLFGVVAALVTDGLVGRRR